MLLAYSQPGFTKAYVEKHFGLRGLENLEILLKAKALKEENGQIKSGSQTINASPETVKALFQNLVANNYDVNTFGNKGNWLSLQFESVDRKKVQPLLIQVLKEANTKIRSIMNAPENTGRDVVWAGLITHSLLKDSSAHEETIQ